MKVCIIGGGQSGLVTCKTFVEQGYDVVVLEKSRYNGMYYKIQEKDYFKWSSSKYVSGFSDFPIPEDYPIWMKIGDYIQYLESYKQHNQLDRYIQYNTKVVNCKPLQNSWQVDYIHDGRKGSYIVDKLIVCTGLNSVPKLPQDIGLHNFKGLILHSDDIYQGMNQETWQTTLQGKRILLLGGGESAFDIGHLCLSYTDQLYFSSKHYIEWFPDFGYSREFLEKSPACARMLQSQFIEKTPFVLPSDTMLSWLEYALPTPMSGIWHEYGRYILKLHLKCSGGDAYTKRCVHDHPELCKINTTPNSLFKKYVVKRTPFYCDLHANKVHVVHYPARVEGKKVYLHNGDVVDDIDIIICATGYQKTFDFLEESLYINLDHKPDFLIKKMVPTHQQNIAFVGFARPTMGSINNVAEMQSWWLSLFFKGRLKYTHRDYAWARPQDPLSVENQHVDTIVIGNYYYKDLALDMHIYPNMTQLFFTKPRLWFHIMHSTIHPMVFRLQGHFYHDQAERMYLQTLPSVRRITETSMLTYYFLFIIMHTIFILITVVFSLVLVYILKKLGVISSVWPYFVLFSIVGLVYTYHYWY